MEYQAGMGYFALGMLFGAVWAGALAFIILRSMRRLDRQLRAAREDHHATIRALNRPVPLRRYDGMPL